MRMGGEEKVQGQLALSLSGIHTNTRAQEYFVLALSCTHARKHNFTTYPVER
jgi:hypothetical protein